jgi:hypothetical protein
MIVRRLMGLVLFGLMGINAMATDIVVNVRPPHAIVERRGPAPGRAYVWLPGYHNWNARSYVWVPGRWELPPRPRAHWVAPRWVHRNHGWVLIEGRWR